jgi:D-amino acid aminotransferase
MNSDGPYVHLNGRLVAADKARVSALDRGLLYGDGLFETIRVYRGTPFALEEHMNRLANSGHILGIVLPPTDWGASVRALLERNGLADQDARVRVTITRGVGPSGLLPPVETEPTVLITAETIGEQVRGYQQRGVAAVLLPFGREGFLAEHKTLDYLPGVLGRTLAARHKAYEGLFVTPTGRVTEGTASNLFVVRAGRLVTPPIRGILPGITRGHVIHIAESAGLPVNQQTITLASLAGIKEAFLTSSVVEIVPLVSIDDRPVGSGQVGPVTRRVQRLHQAFVGDQLRHRSQRSSRGH